MILNEIVVNYKVDWPFKIYNFYFGISPSKVVLKF